LSSDAYHKFRDVKPYNIEDIIAIDREVRGYINSIVKIVSLMRYYY